LESIKDIVFRVGFHFRYFEFPYPQADTKRRTQLAPESSISRRRQPARAAASLERLITRQQASALLGATACAMAKVKTRHCPPRTLRLREVG
jgi:hypothetical protein